MAYNLKQWSVGKLATSAAIILLMAVCSWLAIRVFFTNENANAEFSYEIINNTDKEIEEIIIGEFRDSDSTGATDRVSITLIGGQSRTKGAVAISKDTDKIGNFYIQAEKDGKRVFLAPTLAYDIGKKGLHIKITIDEIDSEGYYTGKVETNTFVFSEFKIEPTSQKAYEKEKTE